MAKKEANKKKNCKCKSPLSKMDLFKDVDKQAVLLNTISVLKEFCDENILSLQPILDEDENNEQVMERVIKFATIADILDSVENLLIHDKR